MRKRDGYFVNFCTLTPFFLTPFFRAWPLVVVSFHFWYFYRGLEPHLQRAHAGHTQAMSGNAVPPAP